jgi:hypothetical protein
MIREEVRMSKWSSIFAITCILILYIAVDAFPFKYHECATSKITWASNSPKFRVKDSSFPSGYKNALRGAVAAWNNNPSKFTFDLEFGEEKCSPANLQNEIYFTENDSWLDGAPAVTIWWHYCANITVADVLFDSREPWTTSDVRNDLMAYDGDYRPFQLTVMHELGHALGLDHTSGQYSIMGTDYTHIQANNGAAQYYPGEDAAAGAVFLYGLESSKGQDVSISHFVYAGYASGEYSVHKRSAIYKKDGTYCESFTDTKYNHHGEPGFQVTKGKTILLELTYENSGAHSHEAKVGYYLSGNDNISTYDDRIDTRTITIGRNSVNTTTHEIVVPDTYRGNTMKSGETYYLGAIIDMNDNISEVNEQNNATYIAIRIK